MDQEKRKIFYSVMYPFLFVIVLWIIEIFDSIFQFNFVYLGIYPRDLSQIYGIITGPLIHKDFDHLFANSLPLLVLGSGVIYSYKTASVKVIPIIYLFSGLLVWLFGREAFHIGASGLIYGLISFLFFSGLIRRDNRSIALSLIVTFLYGSLVWGILPIEQGVSWEGHLFGALVGIACAFIFKKYDPAKKYDWEDEE